MDRFVPLFQTECRECGHEPTVGVRDADGPAYIRNTGLCGPHHFQDRMMIDWELWNEWPESSE